VILFNLVRQYENRIDDLSIQNPSISHDSNPIDENLEWFRNYMELEVKVDPLLFQDRINGHYANLEVDPIKKKKKFLKGYFSNSTIYVS